MGIDGDPGCQDFRCLLMPRNFSLVVALAAPFFSFPDTEGVTFFFFVNVVVLYSYVFIARQP